ncbi:MAG: DUF4389 domain-containing protein [bacterium]|nr:DUF4389 domain-containing protein [Gammaproteobacteria bacterium]
MEEKTRRNMTSSDIWSRALYMVLFAIAFGIAKIITILLVLFQFFAILVNGRANEQLLRFGRNLSFYVLEMLEFQTFSTELHPFPFSPWPDEEPGGDVWLDSEDDDDYSEIDEAESDEVEAEAATASTDEDEVVVKPVVDKPAEDDSNASNSNGSTTH